LLSSVTSDKDVSFSESPEQLQGVLMWCFMPAPGMSKLDDP
jgi:hypothetical protein